MNMVLSRTRVRLGDKAGRGVGAAVIAYDKLMAWISSDKRGAIRFAFLRHDTARTLRAYRLHCTYSPHWRSRQSRFAFRASLGVGLYLCVSRQTRAHWRFSRSRRACCLMFLRDIVRVMPRRGRTPLSLACGGETTSWSSNSENDALSHLFAGRHSVVNVAVA